MNGFDVESPSLRDIPKFFYSLDARRKLNKLIEHTHPDIAHLHIYYGQVTPSILSILKEHHIPVVQTLHEYKLLCPISSLTRNGIACELCSNGTFWHAVWHRCNRGSLPRSIITALEAYSSNMLSARSPIDHFIAVSDFVRNKMIEHGLPEEKITTVHNFVRDEVFLENDREGQYFLYFGRLEKIKGIKTLIRAMVGIQEVDLLIVGSGDEREQLECEARELALTNVHFLGFKAGQALTDLIAGAICIVAPSEWRETFGLVLVESFAQSRPVIASRMGGMTEVVTESVDGLLFDAGDVRQLREALHWMASHRQQAVAMGKAGLKKARRQFSADKYYTELMRVYRMAAGA
jgi:glycosyltransferase involved in cell wall biosynthesis